MSHENSQHIVVVGTKPDIIKQAPIYHELRERRLERFRTEQPPYSLLVRGIELDSILGEFPDPGLLRSGLADAFKGLTSEFDTRFGGRGTNPLYLHLTLSPLRTPAGEPIGTGWSHPGRYGLLVGAR